MAKKDFDIDTLRATTYLWLVYTAKAMGQTKDKQTTGNEFSKDFDPAASLTISYMFCMGTPMTIYELAKGNRMGSYRTIRRRLQHLERDKVVYQDDQERWLLTDYGTKLCADYAKVMYTLGDRVDELLSSQRQAAAE